MNFRSLFALAPAFLAACSSTGTTSTTQPGGGDPVALVAAADAGRGRTVFEQNGCNGCHGGMMSTGRAPSLVGTQWDDGEVREAFTIIGEGEDGMPSFGNRLSEQQIADVIAYLKTLAK